MHILVTGGCGYIGTVLTQRLLELGHKVTVVDILWFGNHLPAHKNLQVIQTDIRDIDSVPLSGVNAVMHLANIANDPCGELSAKLSWEVNVLATMRLVEKAIRFGVRQFIDASSGSVYGVQDAPQVTEDLPLVPISDYNKTKMISERVLDFPVMLDRRTTPRTVRAKYSAGPKARADRARSGANNCRAMTLTVPATKDATAAIANAAPARPLRAMA